MFEQEKQTARINLGISNPDQKIILSIDGGGMRGILTLQLLKRLEQIAGSPCYKWVDFVSGTSTGAIISGLILAGKSAIEIEELYKSLVTRVFKKRSLTSSRTINPPEFDKVNYRDELRQLFTDETLEYLSKQSGIDCLFTSKDMAAGEEVFFTAIQNNGSKGTYKSSLMRGVLEATMSAPTYFLPFERFIDGGTTTFNNPVLAAAMEAFYYDGKGKYTPENTTIFSFGTGTCLRFVDPNKTSNPDGIDAFFWLNYVMDESSKDASEMQVNMLRSGLIPHLDFRRYQLSLDMNTLNKMPDKDISKHGIKNKEWLYQLTDKELAKIDMADVTKFGLMEAIGEAAADFICPPAESQIPIANRSGNWFQKDLLAPNSKSRGALVSARGNIAQIQSHLSNPAWIDSVKTE
jgi:hypothetical protein